MSPARLIACLVLAAAMAPGCAVSQGRRDPPGWLAARGADFMDIVGLRVYVGPGLGAYVRATQYVQLGILKKGPGEQDLPAPKGDDLRAIPCVGFGTIGRYGGLWLEGSSEVMFPGWSSRDRAPSAESPLAIRRETLAGYVAPHGELDMWRESFGLGAHLLLAGVEAEVRPFQLIDFLGGIAGYDPAGDDLPDDSARSPADDPASSTDDSSASN
jgi:hypothetical protein